MAKKTGILFLLTMVLLVLVATPALAFSNYGGLATKAYPGIKGSKLDGCSLCHNADFTVNKYGKDWTANAKNFKKIEAKDSDGDGVNNLAEITAKTFPGDPKDKPAALAGSKAVVAKPATTQKPAVPQKEVALDYVGSQACAGCHKAAYESWKTTYHSKMIQKINRDNTGAVIKDGVVIVPDAAWDKQLTEYTAKDGSKQPLQQFTLDYLKLPGFKYPTKSIYTIGSKNKQRFMFQKGSDPVNDLYILPQEYIVEQLGQGGKWQNYGGDAWKAWRQCAGCHATGVKITDRPEKEHWKVSIKEFGIGCEACHGPGSQHIASGGKKDKIYNSAASNACNACHTRGFNDYDKKNVEFIPNFMPWDDAGNVSGKFTHAGEKGKGLSDFWGDDPVGAPSKSHHQEYLDWRRTGHAKSLTSLLANPNAKDSCLQCHSATYRFAPEGAKPTLADFKEGGKLAKDRTGVTCAVCHAAHTTKTVTKLEPTQLRVPKTEVCSQCHRTSSEIAAGKPPKHPQKEMRNGSGAIQVAEVKPSKAETCTDCHMPGVAKSGVWGDIPSHLNKPVTSDQKANWKMTYVSYVVDSTELKNIQSDIKGKLDALQPRLEKAKAKLDDPANKSNANLAKAKAEYDIAYTNLEFVKNDGSYGFHNYEYAKAILKSVEERLSSFESLLP